MQCRLHRKTKPRKLLSSWDTDATCSARLGSNAGLSALALRCPLLDAQFYAAAKQRLGATAIPGRGRGEDGMCRAQPLWLGWEPPVLLDLGFCCHV
jgi:hypothetical protein